MLMREFVFPPTREGYVDCELILSALQSVDPKQCTGEERGHVATCQRQMNAITDPLGEVDEFSPDVRKRKLKPEGGKICVPVKVFERLDKWIDDTPFFSGLAVQVQDLKDRMTIAQTVEEHK